MPCKLWSHLSLSLPQRLAAWSSSLCTAMRLLFLDNLNLARAVHPSLGAARHRSVAVLPEQLDSMQVADADNDFLSFKEASEPAKKQTRRLRRHLSQHFFMSCPRTRSGYSGARFLRVPFLGVGSIGNEREANILGGTTILRQPRVGAFLRAQQIFFEEQFQRACKRKGSPTSNCHPQTHPNGGGKLREANHVFAFFRSPSSWRLGWRMPQAAMTRRSRRPIGHSASNWHLISSCRSE